MDFLDAMNGNGVKMFFIICFWNLNLHFSCLCFVEKIKTLSKRSSNHMLKAQEYRIYLIFQYVFPSHSL